MIRFADGLSAAVVTSLATPPVVPLTPRCRSTNTVEALLIRLVECHAPQLLDAGPAKSVVCGTDGTG